MSCKSLHFFALIVLIATLNNITSSPCLSQQSTEGGKASLITPASSTVSRTDWRFWRHEDVKSLDPWGDSDNDARDAVAVYAKENVDTLYFRIDFLNLRSDTIPNIYFAIDYKPGGNTSLVATNQDLVSDISWDLLLWLSESGQQAAFDTNYVDHPTVITHFTSDSELDYVEFSITEEALTDWDSNPFNLQAIITDSSSNSVLDKVTPVSTDSTTGRAKLVLAYMNMFSSYGPHSVSWYDGFALAPGRRSGERRGIKYFLDAIEKYELPLTILDLRMDVLPGNDYLPINDRLRNMTHKGILDPPETLIYGHFMPWQPFDVDTLAIRISREYREIHNLPQSEIFFPYEAMLSVGDLEAIKQTGYRAVYGFDRFRYWFGWIDDWSNATAVKESIESVKKVHMVNGLKLFFDPRIGNYQGFAWDSRWGTIDWGNYSEYGIFEGTDRGLHLWWRRILLDLALDSDQEKYFTIGTDILLTPMVFQDVAEWNGSWLASHPWIEVTTFSDILDRNWAVIDHGDLNLSPDQPLEQHPPEGDMHYNAYFWDFYYGGISDGHSPLISPGANIEGYFDYIPYLRNGERIPSGMKMGDDQTSGTIVYETLHNLRNAPDNTLTRLGWLSYFILTGEQTFHSQTLYAGGEEPLDDYGGEYLHPVAKLRANYLRQVNKIVAAANWADESANGMEKTSIPVLTQDLDLDGEDEVVMKNDKVFLVFENDGGRMEYAFTYDSSGGPVQVVGPNYQNFGIIEPGWNYEDGETALRPSLRLSPVFWDAAFVEEGYEYGLFDISLGDSSLSFTSKDGNIMKTFTLEDNTISAHYSINNLDEIRVGFGLPADMANMYSKDWVEKIAKVISQEAAGWQVADGGYAVVNLLDTHLQRVDSFTDSPAREEMEEREDFNSYPDGHWFFFPYNTVTVTGDGVFNLSLTLSAKPIESPVLERTSKPLTWRLDQNFPNPFNPETVIQYELPRVSNVEISIFNLRGQKVATLVNGERTAGSHKMFWNGTDEYGQLLASGVYLYQLKVGKFIEVKKMLLLR